MHTHQWVKNKRVQQAKIWRRKRVIVATFVAALSFGIGAVVIIAGHSVAQATPVTTTSGTTVDVTQADGYYGRRFIAAVDGPVSLVVLSAQNIATGAGCRSVYGQAGPHQSGYPIGAECSGPGTVIVDTVVYPACDQHIIIVADMTDIVFDQLLGTGDCTPPTTTVYVPPSTTVPPTTTTRPLNARYCTRRATKGGRACLQYNCAPGPDPAFCKEP